MRILIIGDIHANLEAFQAVIEDAGRQDGFERVWCLGDVVGYGPDPLACIALLGRYPHVCVAGNHDRGVVGWLDLGDFNPYAAAVCRWTASRLRQEDIAYLVGLPETAVEGEFTLVHGSLRHPIWEYIMSESHARATFERLKTRVCLAGHSHVPFLCREAGGRADFALLWEREPLRLGEGRWILNPGSVGQPRDGDPRASYVLYDTCDGTLFHRRVEYDIEAVQEKMREAGLPQPLIERLSYGR